MILKNLLTRNQSDKRKILSCPYGNLKELYINSILKYIFTPRW